MTCRSCGTNSYLPKKLVTPRIIKPAAIMTREELKAKMISIGGRPTKVLSEKLIINKP